MEIWTDSKVWSENWLGEKEVLSGGQAAAKLVRNKETQKLAFLKILSRQGDSERRARFFREATAYETTAHHLIPSLIESNSHKHQDSDYKLYLITEYIEGPTLTEHIGHLGHLDFLDASSVLLGLLDTIDYCHANELIHRDIKPDNIILKNSNVETPILLDFGIAYKDSPNNSFATDYGQELGNRFLRLPELSAGSTSKQDKRADVSFLGGILYYQLTGVVPSILLDEEGRMPHQRADIVNRLQESFNGKLHPLLEFFDKSFSPKLSGRFSSARAMKTSLERLIGMHGNPDLGDVDTSIDEILAFVNSSSNRELSRIKDLCDLARKHIEDIHSQIGKQVVPTCVQTFEGYKFSAGELRYGIGFAHLGSSDRKFIASFLVKLVGNELVVMVNGAPFYRTDSEDPLFSNEFEEGVRRMFLKGLKDLSEKSVP